MVVYLANMTSVSQRSIDYWISYDISVRLGSAVGKELTLGHPGISLLQSSAK